MAHEIRFGIVFGVLFAALLPGAVASVDWPEYLHDTARSGVTTQQLSFPLHEAWVFQARHAPRPAWPAPAKQDFWNEVRELKPVVIYDRAYHAVIADGRLYFGTSSNDKVFCLDAATGEIRWSFYTGGPVRLAPAIRNGKVYFGADDGLVYCLDAVSGERLWTYRPDTPDRLIAGNGRVISFNPVRTGVVVEEDRAYSFAGLFPSYSVYMNILNAGTGEAVLSNKTEDLSPQGYLLASPSRLFVPTGRTTPAVFDRASAAYLGQLEGGGGAYAVLVDDALATGPGIRRTDLLQMSDPETNERIATCDGMRMVVSGPMSYMQTHTELMALDRPAFLALGRERTTLETERKQKDDMRKVAERAGNADAAVLHAEEIVRMDQELGRLDEAMRNCYTWRVPCIHPFALILAGETLIAGGDNEVAAFSVLDGATVWKAPVTGRAYGLSVAHGKLYVSTAAGTIHCFGEVETPGQLVREEAMNSTSNSGDAVGQYCAMAADAILQSTGIRQGYCVVLDCGEGRLIKELVEKSNLHVIGLERDPAKVQRAREMLDAAGLYGLRTAVKTWDGGALPFTSWFVNLVVSEGMLREGTLPPAPGEIYRVLRPYGGTALIGVPQTPPEHFDPEALRAWLDNGGIEGSTLIENNGIWACFSRGVVPGAGEWTQLYADASHTACSMDEIEGPVTVQWFGEPGPRDMVDRHHRPTSSLFKEGRLFVPGNDVVFALDAYNGTLLWTNEAPGFRRTGIMKSSGTMLLTDDLLYVILDDTCVGMRVEDGAPSVRIGAPRPEDEKVDWGYLNVSDNLLIGTAQKPDAAFREMSKTLVNMLEGDFRPVVISRYLFAVDRYSGEEQWRYVNGAIMTPAVTVAEGRVYFVECRRPTVIEDKDGRIGLKQFLSSETFLTALDLKTGEKIWEHPVNFPFHHIMFANGARNVLLVSGSYNEEDKVYYGLFAYDMSTGEALWNTPFRAKDIRCTGWAETGGSHGEQWQHPVLIGDTIYARPFAFNLHTGEQLDYIAYRGGHGCGGLTGSVHYLYGRGSNPRMYPLDVTSTEGIPLTRVSRPGCWLNIIPAGGMILIPESSSGCTCSYPLQTSFGLIPQAAAMNTGASEHIARRRANDGQW